MIIAFILSMPGCNSWNGKWSRADRLHAIVKNFGKTQKAEKRGQGLLDKGYFSYSFGDGWRAGIELKKVDAKEAAQIRKRSVGFAGYDWMVDSILAYGQILNDAQAQEFRKARADAAKEG